jgi:hypothetical protein
MDDRTANGLLLQIEKLVERLDAAEARAIAAEKANVDLIQKRYADAVDRDARRLRIQVATELLRREQFVSVCSHQRQSLAKEALVAADALIEEASRK